MLRSVHKRTAVYSFYENLTEDQPHHYLEEPLASGQEGFIYGYVATRGIPMFTLTI